MEKFDIRQYKYGLILCFILLTFILIVFHAYKFLPKFENNKDVIIEQIDKSNNNEENISTNNDDYYTEDDYINEVYNDNVDIKAEDSFEIIYDGDLP